MRGRGDYACYIDTRTGIGKQMWLHRAPQGLAPAVPAQFHMPPVSGPSGGAVTGQRWSTASLFAKTDMPVLFQGQFDVVRRGMDHYMWGAVYHPISFQIAARVQEVGKRGGGNIGMNVEGRAQLRRVTRQFWFTRGRS